jgi:glucose-6-phosphate isomerase
MLRDDTVTRTLHVSAGPLANAITENRDRALRAAAGLWRKDPAVWSRDADVRKTIANRLGWLSAPRLMSSSVDRLTAFAERVKRDGFTDVVLLGMGGSSLAPEVLRAIVGVRSGFPRLHMLDSTDPAAVIAASTPPDRTLYVLASKSGTTIEPNSLAAHFKKRLQDASINAWANHFVAITDEGTSLDRLAREEKFREVFVNPSDIGGRYSAVSFFGMVPAALMGQDLTAIIGSAVSFIETAQSAPDSTVLDSGAELGLLIGAGARAGRDKLTLLLSRELEPFGLWVEQLIAESTGKEGHGVVPIAGESTADANSYGSDRLFVHIRERDPQRVAPQLDALAKALADAGHPVATIDLPGPTALGAEFVQWEIATAVAGALIGINPFDEPNVQQAKDATRALLDQFKLRGALPVPKPDSTADNVSFTLTKAARTALAGQNVDAFLSTIERGDYFGLLTYLGPDPSLRSELDRFRTMVRNRTGAATMFGYGPRYLHSTGQLHKGGPNTGVFIVVTAAPREDVPIPSEPFSFGTLEFAQALGDFASLDTTGRRALHIHLPVPDAAVLRRAFDVLTLPV